MNHRNNMKILIIYLFLIIMFSAYSFSYDVRENKEVHQYISEQSSDVWIQIPDEMSKNIELNPYFFELNSWGYSSGDNLLTGSGEEDTEFDATCLNEVAITLSILYPTISPEILTLWGMTVARPFCYHFWNPDNPNTLSKGDDDYNDGWAYHGSNYKKAKEYWDNKVIPFYLEGEKEEAYYWLGRVSHLLEDMTSIPHVHNDMHALIGDKSPYEEYTAQESVYEYYTVQNQNLAGKQYNYEDLPNTGSFDWSEVEPNNQQNLDLFRLFWYTAQKTQYWASNDVDGNDEYRKVGDDILYDFSSEGIDLWSGDNVNIISDNDEVEDNIDDIADALVPHAMKSVAGLYRLFWDSVHSYDWSMYGQNLQRTGMTILRGSIDSDSLRQTSFNLDDGYASGTILRNKPSIADVDSDGEMDIVSTSSLVGYDVESKVYAVECRYRCATKSPVFKTKRGYPYESDYYIMANPTVENIDTDKGNEILLASTEEIIILEGSNGKEKYVPYRLEKKKLTPTSDSVEGEIRHLVAADIDLDGEKEILFTDSFPDARWESKLYLSIKQGGEKL